MAVPRHRYKQTRGRIRDRLRGMHGINTQVYGCLAYSRSGIVRGNRLCDSGFKESLLRRFLSPNKVVCQNAFSGEVVELSETMKLSIRHFDLKLPAPSVVPDNIQSGPVFKNEFSEERTVSSPLATSPVITPRNAKRLTFYSSTFKILSVIAVWFAAAQLRFRVQCSRWIIVPSDCLLVAQNAEIASARPTSPGNASVSAISSVAATLAPCHAASVI